MNIKELPKSLKFVLHYLLMILINGFAVSFAIIFFVTMSAFFIANDDVFFLHFFDVIDSIISDKTESILGWHFNMLFLFKWFFHDVFRVLIVSFVIGIIYRFFDDKMFWQSSR